MKQKVIFSFLNFLLTFIVIAETQAAVAISPSSVNVARGQGNTVALTYHNITRSGNPSALAGLFCQRGRISGKIHCAQVEIVHR